MDGDDDVSQWVPGNCKLFLMFDPARGWSASLRLRHDYLGYLVDSQPGVASVDDAIAAVRVKFQAAQENPDGLDVAKAGYFRQITPFPHRRVS